MTGRIPPTATGMTTGTNARQGFGGSARGRVRNAGPVLKPPPGAAPFTPPRTYAWKSPVRAASAKVGDEPSPADNVTLSGLQSVDGISLLAGDRVLIKNQTNEDQNGIYVVAEGAWTRASDADSASTVFSGIAVMVQEGDANHDRGFVLMTDGAITVGSSPLVWERLDRPQVYVGNTAPNPRGTYVLWVDTSA